MSFKDKTIDFIKTLWQERHQKPSMREIARNLNVSTSKLYKNFSGKNEMYRLAGVPNDESSILKTVSALKAKKKYAKAKKVNHKTEDHSKNDNVYILNVNQTDSLRGLAFLECRKALHHVVDEILSFHHQLYKLR